MNSQDKQFLKYTPVNGEKHLGIAVVRWLGKIILRFKVLPSQNGTGYWLAAGSTKIGLRADGKDNYEPWFDLDSNYEKEEMKDFVLYHVENAIRGSTGQQYNPSPSANPQQTAQAPLSGQGNLYGQQPQQTATQQTFDDGLPF